MYKGNVTEINWIYRLRQDSCSARSIRKLIKKNRRNCMHFQSNSIQATICSSLSCCESASYFYCRYFTYCKKCCLKFKFTQNHSSQDSSLCSANVPLSVSACSDISTWRRAIPGISRTRNFFSLTGIMKMVDGHCGYYRLMMNPSL